MIPSLVPELDSGSVDRDPFKVTIAPEEEVHSEIGSASASATGGPQPAPLMAMRLSPCLTKGTQSMRSGATRVRPVRAAANAGCGYPVEPIKVACPVTTLI